MFDEFGPHGAEEEREELWTDLSEVPDEQYNEDDRPPKSRMARALCRRRSFKNGFSRGKSCPRSGLMRGESARAPLLQFGNGKLAPHPAVLRAAAFPPTGGKALHFLIHQKAEPDLGGQAPARR